MLSSKHICFFLFVGHLLPLSLGNAIPRDLEVHFAADPALDGAPSPKVSSRDFEVHFAHDPALDEAPSSNGPKVSPRNLEVHFAVDPSLDEPSTPKVSSRDQEADFATDPELNEAPISDDSQIFARALTGLDLLLKNDQQCANRKNWPRSFDLEKRVKPSDVLWNVGQAIVVNMGLASYHAWNQAPEAIGTYGLCGCTAVAIVGQAGAIVAHIQPNQAQFQNQMNRIRDLFNNNIRGQTLPRVFLLTPTLNDVVQVQPWQDQISTFLSGLGVAVQDEHYPMVLNGGARDGTLVVQRVAGAIKVWLNEKLISSS